MRKFSDGLLDFCLIARLVIFVYIGSPVGSSYPDASTTRRTKSETPKKRSKTRAMTTMRQTAALVPCPWASLGAKNGTYCGFLAAATYNLS